MSTSCCTPLSLLPLDQAFDLSARGGAELHGHATTLRPAELELLIRLDGTLTLREVRGTMPHASDAQFAAAFKILWTRELVARARPDPFDARTTLQLQMLHHAAGEHSAPDPLRKSGFSVGLTWLRPGPPRRSLQAPRRAVVVEDDPVLSRMIECFLALEGFEVSLAADRSQVVAVLNRRQLPDVVLLDMTLPDVEGLEVLHKVRQHPLLRDVPALMLTGRATREAVLQALAGGADGYLTKPFDPESLIFAVKRLTGLDAGPPPGADPWSNADARLTREDQPTQPMPLAHGFEPTRPMAPMPAYAPTQPAPLIH